MVAPAVPGKAVRCDGEDIIKVHLCAWNRAFRVCVCERERERERESVSVCVCLNVVLRQQRRHVCEGLGCGYL